MHPILKMLNKKSLSLTWNHVANPKNKTPTTTTFPTNNPIIKLIIVGIIKYFGILFNPNQNKKVKKNQYTRLNPIKCSWTSWVALMNQKNLSLKNTIKNNAIGNVKRVVKHKRNKKYTAPFQNNPAMISVKTA